MAAKKHLLKGDYCVYQHTTPPGKKYIGITKQKPERRWRNGEGYLHTGRDLTPFGKAILKYGWDNIEHEILVEHLTYEEACAMERALISEERTDDRRYGYNVLPGGDIPLATCPDKVREKMRKSALEKWKRPEYVEGHSGANHWTHKNGYNRKNIEAMRQATLGRKEKPEQIEAKRERAKHQKRKFGRENKTSKPVICYTVDGEEVARYGGTMEAFRETGIWFQGISLVCRGKQKTAGGFVWKFEADIELTPVPGGDVRTIRGEYKSADELDQADEGGTEDANEE